MLSGGCAFIICIKQSCLTKWMKKYKAGNTWKVCNGNGISKSQNTTTGMAPRQAAVLHSHNLIKAAPKKTACNKNALKDTKT